MGGTRRNSSKPEACVAEADGHGDTTVALHAGHHAYTRVLIGCEIAGEREENLRSERI